jgi:hypothetical protein
MKKAVSMIFVLFLFGFFATTQAQVQSGSYHFDQSAADYSLHKNDGNRTVEVEVKFNKAFEKTPKIFLSITKIDSKNDTQMRYAVGAKYINRDGFTLRVTVWADTKISAIGGDWIAHEE